MVTTGSIEKERIERIKSLNNEELTNYMKYLVKEATFINNPLKNKDLSSEKVKSVLDKIDELIQIRRYNSNIEVVVARNLYQAETSSHIDTLIRMYKDKISDVLKTVGILVSDLRTEYLSLNFNVMLLYDLCFHKRMLLSADSVINLYDEEKSEVMINTIFSSFDSAYGYFEYLMPNLVKQTKFTIERLNEYLDDMPSLEYLDEIKEDCIKFDKESNMDYLKDTDYNKNRLKTIDYILTLYEVKESIKIMVNPILELLESDNVFYEFSKSNYEKIFSDQDVDSESYVNFEDFMKTEIKYNLKDYKLTY